MLKEARIVMPSPAGDGMDHESLRTAIVAAFGGYTCTTGVGAWRPADSDTTIVDKVAIYDVAIEAERDASWDMLFQIAMQAGRDLKQEAVYIRYPDGAVEIAKVPGPGEVTWRENYAEGGNPTKVGGDPAKVPLGGRRLPQVGEIWETSCGDKVAVVKTTNIIELRLDVVVLANGPTSPASFKAGVAYDVDEDGKVLRDHTSHPRDLKRFVKDF